MKKLFTLVLSTLLALPILAGKPATNWSFSLDDEGECVVEKTFTTSKDATAALKSVKQIVNRETFENRSVLSEETGVYIEYDLQKNTKSSYNPFAGSFQESMRFKLVVSYDNGTVKVTCSEFNLINKYQGFGANTRTESFNAKIAEYNELKEAVANGTIKGKDKKDALDKIEDTDESLNVCWKELDAFLQNIKRAF